MSVIAKLLIRGISTFGTGQLVELACLCDNDLMTAYAATEEDKLFTKYSPWGEMKLCQPAGHSLGREGDEFGPGSAFYVMVLRKEEGPDDPVAETPGYGSKNFPGAYAVCPGKLSNVVDYGDAQARRFEFRNGGPNEHHRGIDRLNWKMNVDNPAVFAQLKAGMDVWIVLYPADKFDRDAAIAAAHHQEKPLAAT